VVSNVAGSTTSAVTRAQAKIELTFWKHSHPPADKLTQTIIDEYMVKNPNVTITMDIIPSDQWQNKILTAAAGGQLPDLFDTNAPQLNRADPLRSLD